VSAVSPELIPLDTSTLVEASAGTGKTYAITTYFVRKILEDGLTPERILVVTYTKAATAELRVRTRSRITKTLAFFDGPPDEPDTLYEIFSKAVDELGRGEVRRRLRGALSEMDQAPILTIHGFCQRLLREHPLSFGIDLEIEVAENVVALNADLAVDFWASDLYDKPEWLLQVLRDRNVNIGHLEKLANVASMPGVEVIGPEPTAVDQEALDDVLRLHRRAASLWFEHRDAILELLKTKGLNGNSYRQASIRKKWTPELNRMFRQASFQPLPDFFERLGAERIKMNKGYERPRHVFFDACEQLLVAHERIEPMLDYAVFSFQRRFCDFVHDRARRRRTEAAVFSFDDLLTTVHAALTDDPTVAATVRQAYSLALIDEFQDTDSVQYGIFRAIYGEGAAIYVGDPKQAIYAFRGADVFSYLQASKDVGENKCTLTTNRRSDPGVVGAINTLFSELEPPFLIEGIDFEDAVPHANEDRSTLGPPLDLVFLDGQSFDGPVATCVGPVAANEVALLLESGALIGQRPIEPGDVAVLCRSNNQAITVTRALRALNVPTSLDGDASVLNTEIATDLFAVLEAALMPGDSRAVRRALLTSLVGVSPFELASMDEDDDAWSKWASRFREWNEAWHASGVLRFLEEMLSYTGAETTIASRPTAGRDLTDLAHLQELLVRGERERHRDPVALMQWFRRLDAGAPDEGMVPMEDLQQRADAQSGAVRVTTIHKSKGLEYGIVFCPFTWNDASLWDFDRVAVRFHDDDGRLRVDLGSADVDEHREQSKLEAASEALRLLYVAVTRAKHQCTLFWGPGYRWKDSALRYLIHGADDDIRLDEQQMLDEVKSFVAKAGAGIGWRPRRTSVAEARHEDSSHLTLEASVPKRTFEHTPRIASFTSLSGHEERVPGRLMAETTSPLFEDLPGGARSGLLLHSIFEHGELDRLDSDESRALVERQLSLYGFEPKLGESVQRDLITVASTPIMPEPGVPPLGELRRAQQLRELEFTLAVEEPNLRTLSELLKKHGAPKSAPAYHERLAQVSGQTLRGFLRGFIDLMFQHEGRWYVADYKSNRLPSYEQPDVIEAVQRQHYVLQGLLYAAAAHRYLSQRDSSYDPTEHWGGALFLFVRGMAGPESAGSSVFFDRQDAELLAAMDAWLGGRNGAR
jgi:exodeoxyribonuclease V beta subunit